MLLTEFPSFSLSLRKLLGILLAKRPFLHYLYSGRTHQLALLPLQSLLPAIYGRASAQHGDRRERERKELSEEHASLSSL